MRPEMPFARQGGGGADGVVQGLGRRLVVGAEVAKPLFETASATAAAFGSSDPAAQLGGFLTRQTGGKGAVGGVEQMVALVEDDAFEGGGLPVLFQAARGAGPVEGGLGHDQGVIGDDEVGSTAGADGLFDETGPVVGTGGVDAFAAPVDQIAGARPADPGGDREQARQPAGEVAAGHVAVAAVQGPAAGQGQADQVAVAELRGLDHVLQVQQTEVVLAAFSNHRLDLAHGGVGPQGLALAVDLALEGAGVGRDPGRALVPLGPERGGGEIAEGLAGAGAGLGEKHAGAALLVSRREGEGGLGGIVGLGRAGFVEPRGFQQFGQADAGGFGIDRRRPGFPARSLVLPFRQPGPGVQTRAAFAGGGAGAETCRAPETTRRPPGPAGAAPGSRPG